MDTNLSLFGAAITGVSSQMTTTAADLINALGSHSENFSNSAASIGTSVSTLNKSMDSLAVAVRGLSNTVGILAESTATPSNSVPFTTTAVSGSHSALAGVLAGFALTALFLLIERSPKKREVGSYNNAEQKTFSQAMLLLFIAFLTGGLSSYLYSTMTGDIATPRRGFFLFTFPSEIFALLIFTLFGGINFTFDVFPIDVQIRTLARRISYGVFLFTIFVVCDELYDTFKWFHPGYEPWGLFLAVGVSGILAPMCILGWKSRSSDSLVRRTFSCFCYAVVVLTLTCAWIQSYNFNIGEHEVVMTLPMALGLDFAIAAVGTWMGVIVHAWSTKELTSSLASTPHI
ncbi:MAG: hypothetical protein K8R88_13720 [Armatimonadetes bacterium]|nr:hypothetical protein [Armatimonadota bacterium]